MILGISLTVLVLNELKIEYFKYGGKNHKEKGANF